MGSYIEEYNNGFEIIQLKNQSLDTPNSEAPAYSPGGANEEERSIGFEKLYEFVHPYPATKV